MTATAVKGFRSIGAFLKGSVWDTAVQAGAGHGIPFISEKIQKKITLDPNEELDTDASPLPGDKSSQQYAGSFDTYLRYTGLDRLFAHALGDDAITTIDVATAFRHEMIPQNDREGLFGCLVFNKGNVIIEEYASVKVTGFTITLKPGKATVTWDVVCSSLAYNTDTGTNTLTTAASITVPSANDAVMFQHMAVSLKPVSDTAAFDANDLAYVNEVVISCKQPVIEDDFSTRGGTIIDEPIADGKWDVGLKLGWRKLTVAAQPGAGNSALLAAAQTKAQYKARVLLTGPGIGSGSNVNSMTFWFPCIQIEDSDSNVDGANVSPTSVQFKGHRATSLPTGFMTGATTAIALEIQNSNSTAADL